MTQVLSRRNILVGLLAAPAIVRASSLMPIRALPELWSTGPYFSLSTWQTLLDNTPPPPVQSILEVCGLNQGEFTVWANRYASLSHANKWILQVKSRLYPDQP